MTWVDKIATAEKGNIPYGAIFLGSIAQALSVIGASALGSKWPKLSRWSPTLVGGAGAVLIPQTKKVIGEPASKSLAMGCGITAAAPWLGLGLSKAVGLFAKPVTGGVPTPTPTPTPTPFPTPIPAVEDLAGSADAGTESREGEEV